MTSKIINTIVFALTFILGIAILAISTAFVPKQKGAAADSLIVGEMAVQKPAATIPDAAFDPKIFGISEEQFYEPTKINFDLVDVAEVGNSYYEDDFPVSSGETWFGLFTVDGKSFLKKTKLKVGPETRVDYGRDDSLTIWFPEKYEPLFIVKSGIPLSEGEVSTVQFVTPDHDHYDGENDIFLLDRGFQKDFTLGNEKYSLKVIDGMTNTNKTVLALVLETVNSHQIVDFGSFFGAGDFFGNILWIGDLDRDLKPDFYISYYNEKGGVSTSLFLSSIADKGELVKRAASFSTPGC